MDLYRQSVGLLSPFAMPLLTHRQHQHTINVKTSVLCIGFELTIPMVEQVKKFSFSKVGVLPFSEATVLAMHTISCQTSIARTD
jgi:hypothetical protein